MRLSVLDYLEEAVEKQPNKTAIVDTAKSISFKHWREQAQSLAMSILESTNSARRKPVVVFVDRNLECLVAFMAVAYSGNFYVPIDKDMPLKRIQLILDTLQPIAIVNTPSSIGFASSIAEGIPEIDYENGVNRQDVDDKLLCLIKDSIIDLDPLYATFTSGSTGVPKGVLTSNRAVIDMTENLIETFNFDQERIFGNQNPFYFDASIKDIYSAMACGATLHIIPRSQFLMLGELVDYIATNKIDTILWSAAAIALLANAKAFEDMQPTCLKQVMFSGEVMHNKVLNYWRKHLPDTLFVNLYGPTEITSVCTFYKVNRPFEDDEVLPIGQPFRNCEILILNENDEEVKGDEKGELCVRGCCLALGYYNNPQKTDEAFVQNPQVRGYIEKIYRTGDMAKYNEDGQILFLSRKDNQVKHMGQRVELGEIEIIMNALEKIDASFCFYDHAKERIICVFEGKDADKTYIYSELRSQVSKYMFPNVLIKLDKMLYNLNGKIDRTSLKERYFKGVIQSL